MRRLNKYLLLWLMSLSTIGLFAQNDVPLEQNLTGYQPPIGKLFYGSQRLDIDAFYRNGKGSLLVDYDRGVLVLLDSTGIKLGEKKLRFRTSQSMHGKIRRTRLSLYSHTDEDNTFILEENDSDRYKNKRHYISIGRNHDMKVKTVGIGRRMLYSKSVFSGSIEFKCIESTGNALYLKKIQAGQQVDTLYQQAGVSNNTVEGQRNISIEMGNGVVHLLDVKNKVLTLYDANTGKLLSTYKRDFLESAFSGTGQRLFRDVKLLVDSVSGKLYIVARKLVGKEKYVLYMVGSDDLVPIKLPTYDRNLLTDFRIAQIFDGNAYLVARTAFKDNKEVIKVALDKAIAEKSRF